MSKTYNQLNNDIGQLLFYIAPDSVKTVIMKAERSPIEDDCKYQFDYLNKSNDINWFAGGVRANRDMLDYLEELR